MADSTPDQVEQQKQHQLQQVTAAVQDPAVPKLYVNGLTVGRSLSDLFIMIMNMGAPIGLVTMSFTTAKTLEEHLHRTLHELEKKIGKEFLTMDDIQKKLQEAGE